MDDILQQAIKERDQARREVDRLDQFIETYKAFAAKRTVVQAPSPAAAAAASLNAISDKVLQMVATANATKRDTIIAAAVASLRETQPQQTDELLENIKAKGVTVGGTNEAINLSSYMSKSEKFQHRRRDGGWFLAPELLPRSDGDFPTGTEGQA